MISPVVGWCLIGTFTNPGWLHLITTIPQIISNSSSTKHAWKIHSSTRTTAPRPSPRHAVSLFLPSKMSLQGRKLSLSIPMFSPVDGSHPTPLGQGSLVLNTLNLRFSWHLAFPCRCFVLSPTFSTVSLFRRWTESPPSYSQVISASWVCHG